ncbi:MAG: SecDF P1 head subdomain-containing protein [Planctomycetota bacterium]|jgi:SecD/SecF fusion protein
MKPWLLPAMLLFTSPGGCRPTPPAPAAIVEFYVAVQRADTTDTLDIAVLRRQLAETGPAPASLTARWLPLADPRHWAGTPEELAQLAADPQAFFDERGLVAARPNGTCYLLVHLGADLCMTRPASTSWSVQRAFPAVDNLGRPATGLGLDGPGAKLLNRLTAANVGRPLAIVIDREVYAAPRVNSAVGSAAIIAGNFTLDDVHDLVRRIQGHPRPGPPAE